MESVRAMVPERAFKMQIQELELDDDINQALARVENVGELMLRLLADEASLERILKQGGAGDDAMEAIRYALDDLVVLRPEPVKPVEAVEPEPEPAPAPAPAPAPEPRRPAEAEAMSAAVLAAEPVAQEVVPAIDDAETEDLPAFVEPEPEPAAGARAEAARPRPAVRRAEPEAATPETVTEGDDADGERKKGKKGKGKRRELVFDESRGEVVSKRHRKGSRRREEWNDEDYF